MTLRTGNAPISTIGVTTADRPDPLARCLFSLARQTAMRNTRTRILVVDSSIDANNESRGRHAASSIQEATGQAILFIGRKEKLALRKALRTLCKDSLLEFAFRPGASGNRNIVLLLSTGENVLLVDDDIVCDVWTLPSLRQVMTLSGHVERRSIAFYKRRPDVCSSLVRADVDLLSAHDAVLGHSLKSLASKRGFVIDRRYACGRVRQAAEGTQPAVLRMTLTGIAGDAGVNYPDRMLFSGGSWKTVLAANRRTFRTAFNFREVCKLGNRYIVMHEIACMAACLGLSNRSMLPPFIPTGRNEDGLFGATLSAIDRAFLSSHVPFAVIHASNRPPRYSGARFPSACETRSADLLISLIASWTSHVSGTRCRPRLNWLGQRLRDLGALRNADFINLTSLATLKTREKELALIDSRLASRGDFPDYWLRDLRTYGSMLARNVYKRSFLVPLEFRKGRNVRAAYDDLQQFVRSAGELYTEWPALWSNARKVLTRIPDTDFS